MEQGNADAPRPMHVLVADDSESMRTLVRITLTSQGWSVTEAATADTARAMTRQLRPDLVILDINFGETGPDGLAVCADLKADPATASIPVVILTAHDDPEERRRATTAQADAFVAKPFGPLDLMRTLRELIPASSQTPALGVLLLDAGAVEPTVLESALAEQQELVDRGTPKRLGDVLLERGSVSGSALDRALLEQMHARAIDSAGTRAKILVIDDHAAVREGLKSLVGEDETLEIVGEAATADEGLRLARRHHPDVIVLDNEMPGRSGIDLLPTLRADVPSAKVVMFSLDGAARDRALAAGADSFLTKVAPMDDILAALRPAHVSAAATPANGNAQIPTFPSARHLRRAVIVMAITFVSYVTLFLGIEQGLGASAGAFSVVPVVIVGALLGPEAGLVGAIVTFLITAALWTLSGHAPGEAVVALGSGVGVVILLLLGFASGAARVFGLRLDPHRRRVEAIAEAVKALAGLDRGEFFDTFLEAMLRLMPGDLALLYTNAVGDARFVAASQPIGDASVGALTPVARETMRTSEARTIDELSESERPASALRSALLVPVTVAGQDVRGVVVILHRDRGRFTQRELALVRPFAQYLWVVLRSTPVMSGHPVANVKEKAT